MNPFEKEAQKHEGRNQYADIRSLKFKDDETRHIRILPKVQGNDFPFYGYEIHWIPQAGRKFGRPIVHPLGKRCAIDEYVSDLWNKINQLKEEEEATDKDPRVKEIYAKIREVSGKKKYDFNIIDLDDPLCEVDGKKIMAPKRLEATKTIWEPIFNLAKNPKWGDPSHTENGYDIEITVDGSGEFRKYIVQGDRDTRPLNEEELEAMKLAYDLPKLRKPSSTKDFYTIIENAKAPFDKILEYMDDDDTDNTPKKKTKKRVKEEVEEEATETVNEETNDEEAAVEEENETAVEEKNEEVKETEEKEVKEEATNDESSNDNEEEVDPSDLNNYTCKGEHDPEDEGCQQCQVEKDCLAFQPIFERANELKIDNGTERTHQEIKKEVETEEKKLAKAEQAKEEKKEEKKEKPALGKKGKRKLPF